jgi:hypothetical protein
LLARRYLTLYCLTFAWAIAKNGHGLRFVPLKYVSSSDFAFISFTSPNPRLNRAC